MCFFYVVYLISGRAFAPGMCALAASTCDTICRVSHTSFVASCGITPACAGKTARLCAELYRSWDHPRVCGENTQQECTFHSVHTILEKNRAPVADDARFSRVLACEVIQRFD